MTKLEKMRKKNGLSQQKLSDISGVSRRVIHLYETKRSMNLRRETMLKLAGALGSTVPLIFFD